MMRFEYQFEEHAPKVTVELSPQSDLAQVLESFEAFLRGAGYYFKGELTIVEPEITEEN